MDDLHYSIATNDQELFNQAYLKVIKQIVDLSEFINHFEDYLDTCDLYRYRDLRKVFHQSPEYEAYVHSRRCPHVNLYFNPDLVSFSRATNLDQCIKICQILVDEGKAQLIAQTIKWQELQMNRQGWETLVPAAIEVLGDDRFDYLVDAEYERIGKEWRSLGFEPVDTPQQWLEKIWHQSDR